LRSSKVLKITIFESMKTILIPLIAIWLNPGLLLAQYNGIAKHSQPEGLNVGDAAPEIELINHSGEKFHLSEQLKKGPVVLVFYRGNWCPYCSRYLKELNEALLDIRKTGAELIGVSPESKEQTKVSQEELTGGMITLLCDENALTMKAYNVAFAVADSYQKKLVQTKNIKLTDHNQQEEAILPVAATYIINTDGMIAFRHFDRDYTNRADIKEILAVLQEI
jgi:peroxiredoxin